MICVICVKGVCFTLLYQKLLYTFADWETNSHFVSTCVLLVHSSSLCVCVWRGENLCLCFPLHKHVGWFWRTSAVIICSSALSFRRCFKQGATGGSSQMDLWMFVIGLFPTPQGVGPEPIVINGSYTLFHPISGRPNIKGGNLGKPYRGPITSLLTGCGTHLCNQMAPPGSQRCTSSWESWLAGRMDGMMGKVALHIFCGKWCQ